jgi:hypothetical protein
MPIVPGRFQPIPTTGPVLPVAIVNQLQDELAAVGFAVTGTEAGATPQFGKATSMQLKAFQTRYQFEATGDLEPTIGAILTNAALVATESDRTKLREKLKSAVNAVPNSPRYDYWLARFAIMAGFYDLAMKVNPHLQDLFGNDIGNDVFTHAPPRAPDIPFPENYYSYRYDLMAQEDIDALLGVGGSSGAQPLLISFRPAHGTSNVDPPRDPVIYDPPPTSPPGAPRGQRLADSARAWLSAIKAWQFGNSEFLNQRYASAVDAYNSCQQATLSYFSSFPDYGFQFTSTALAARIDDLVWRIASDRHIWANVWAEVNWRRQLLALTELYHFDWTPITPSHVVYQVLQANLAGNDQPPNPTSPTIPEIRNLLMDARLLVMVAVLAPLARAEANRLRRQYAAAIDDFSRALRDAMPAPNSNPPQTVPALLRCEFIETPFARLALVETVLDQAEAQYKARASVDDEPDDAVRTQELAGLAKIAQDFNSRQIPGDPVGNAAKPLQHLVAALTYQSALDSMKDQGAYISNVKQALDALHATVTSTIASGDVSSMVFRSIGQTMTVPTIKSYGSLPGLTGGTHPHERYLKFDVPAGQTLEERNPRVYALLQQAQARLLQIWNGFNYLGYRDDYVPPWRFQYLLDRARYFSEHAKNAQRDYLNFLTNAENDEYQEMSAAQTVELEKANVQIETARVDQAVEEVRASNESAQLAGLNANDAQQRATAYEQFSQYADALFDTRSDTRLGSDPWHEEDVHDFMSQYLPGWDTVGTDYGDFLSGGAVGKRHEALLAHAQRGIELLNLELAAKEAEQSKKVAQAQLAVAQAGLIVAGLQRQASLLRHEFALQNLQFMRNRVLNTEQWYRMAGAIRGVADTYLRYAIETSFLAQQAYNFEADTRLNVIRFDYDLSDVGAMLAADFLLSDLDTVEQNLIVSQRIRQQQVRYVLSMAREFPETLRALADTGEAMFNMRLEQLERHFPGLINLRISSVEVQPVALMDPTRVSVEFTQLGTGMIRIKAQPGASPLNVTDLPAGGDWLPNAGTDWPVKVHVSGPETAVFTGLSRQDAASVSTTTGSERGAFEGLPGASIWRIDMSMKENQVVPGTLADVVIIFVMSGYYDVEFKDAVTVAASAPRPLATTSNISARSVLPDAYYSLVHYGQLDWDVSDRMLALTGTPNELRNLAVTLTLVPDGPELGRCYCHYPVRILVASGSVNVLTAVPQFTTTPNGLTLRCAFTGPASTQVTWDFGDGTPVRQGVSVAHPYARPGRYEVMTRLVQDSRLFEYRSAVVVSANHPASAPLAVTPVFSASATAPDGMVTLTVSAPAGVTDVSLDCSAGGARARSDSGPATLKLKPGTYMLDFLATRKLSARFYGKQRYLPAAPIALNRGRIATNRTFDPATGAETTASLNPFGTQLFKNGSVAVTLSPVDRWTLKLPLADNPWFTTVSASDVAEFDGGELSDAILSLEFLSLQ